MVICTKNIPALRFPGFEGEWEEKSLEELCSEFKSGFGITSERITEDGVYPVYGGNGLRGYTDSYTHDGNYLLIGRQGALCGNINRANGKSYISEHAIAVSSNELSDTEWLAQRLDYFELNRLSESSAQPGLAVNKLLKLKLIVPKKKEQSKIASFLTAVDDKIHQLTRKKELLEQYKKGVMQKIFNREIRFRDDEGIEYPEWERKKLNELLFESKKRNYKLVYGKEDVLSVSGEFGIVNQIEFQGRSFAGESVANYHLVEKGDIVYTKSPLKLNPYGIIKVNKREPGIVSTLYAVYKCNSSVSGIYLEYFFQIDDNTNSYLRPLVRKGAKNDMKVNNAHVLTGSIKVPTLKEQIRIVEFFKSLDQKITLVSRQLENMQTWKKGLLQKMFV